jgi:hypothetical protein
VKKSALSEEKFVPIPKQTDAGMKLAELVRKHDISETGWILAVR